MWQCPKCKREFRNTNQNHFCIKPESVDDYIAAQTVDTQPIMQKIRHVIHQAAPECTEKISQHMPAFLLGKNRIYFAAHKNHLGFYPGGDAVNAFAARLLQEGLKFNKGCIHFPWGRPVQYELISEIVQYVGAAAPGRTDAAKKLTPSEILAIPENLTCTCPDTDCRWHGNCRDCIALHRYYAAAGDCQTPNCLKFYLEEKGGDH